MEENKKADAAFTDFPVEPKFDGKFGEALARLDAAIAKMRQDFRFTLQDALREVAQQKS